MWLVILNTFLITTFCVFCLVTGVWRVKLCERGRRLWPMFLGGGKRGWRTWWGLYLTERKRVSSKSFLNSSKLLSEWGRNPERSAFRTIHWRRFFSCVLKNPHHAGLAYKNCATVVAWATSNKAFPASPWARMILKAYRDRAHFSTRAIAPGFRWS